MIKTLQNENLTLKVENHTFKQQIVQGHYKCKECGQVFGLKTDLEDHYEQNYIFKSDENEWQTVKRVKQTETDSKSETSKQTFQKQTPSPKKSKELSQSKPATKMEE